MDISDALPDVGSLSVSAHARPILKTGAFVTVHGLTNRPALNGQLGTIISWSETRERWGVKMAGDWRNGGETSVWLKPQNVSKHINPFAALGQAHIGLDGEPALFSAIQSYKALLDRRWSNDTRLCWDKEPTRSWWANLPPIEPSGDGAPATLVDVVHLVATVTQASAVTILRWRVSRALALELHSALADVKTLSALDEIRPTNIHVLAAHCTNLDSLAIAPRRLAELSGGSRKSEEHELAQRDHTRRAIYSHTEAWLLEDADRVVQTLLAQSIRPRILDCSRMTWDHDPLFRDAEPRGFWDLDDGEWRRDEDDYVGGYDSDEDAPPIRKRGLSDNGLKQATGLLELHLAKCQLITGAIVAAVCKKSPQLRVLNLAECSGISLRSMKAVAKWCPELQELDVSRARPNHIDFWGDYGPQLMDDDFKCLADGCPRLARLLIRGQPSCGRAAVCLSEATLEALERMAALTFLDVRSANVSLLNPGESPRSIHKKTTSYELDQLLGGALGLLPNLRARIGAGTLRVRGRKNDYDDGN